MTTERVQEFLDRLKDEDGLSASSVNHYRTILNLILNEAVQHGGYDANPVRFTSSASRLGGTAS